MLKSMKNSILKFLEPRGLYNNASNKQEKFDWKLKSGSGPTRFNSFYNYRHKRDKIANLAKNKMKLLILEIHLQTLNHKRFLRLNRGSGSNPNERGTCQLSAA